MQKNSDMKTIVIFFALEMESGCFEDTLSATRRTQADGFHITLGKLGDDEQREIYVVRTGVGAENARRAAAAVLQAHRPDYAISAGFAGALIPDFKKSDLFFPSEVCDEVCRLITLDLFPEAVLKTRAAQKNAVLGGRLLTFPGVVQNAQEKEHCAREFGAKAVDMETYALAEICQERGVPLYCVRAISDSLSQEIPKDIQKLMNQKTFMAQLGAAVRTAIKRPGSVLEMAKLREDALAAAMRLADILKVMSEK